MPRLIRRQPLIERVKASLDFGDWYLWLSEEWNDDSYDDWLKLWATPVGIGLNIVFLLARGGSGTSRRRAGESVFGDDGQGGSGWYAWVCVCLVQLLTLLSCANAVFTFTRKRHYRLFEQPVDTAPMTPSARRVRVDSSPMSASPLRYLQHAMASASASARAYPDAKREVWQLSIWDPRPTNLTIFTLFSPGHVLFYYSLLPPAAMDARPSTTVITAIAFGTLLSLQLSMLKSSFRQQAKDNALVHGQVINEYDTKFVRPILNRPVRDVGIQTRQSAVSPRGTRTREVDVYIPTTIVNRGFHVNPNPNYSSQYDPDNLSPQTTTIAEDRRSSFNFTRLAAQTPTANGYANSYTQSVTSSRPNTASGFADHSSPLKPHHERLRDRTPARGDGGSLGVYSHAASPLRKPTSAAYLRGDSGVSARIGGSPLKRTSTTADAENMIRRRTERN